MSYYLRSFPTSTGQVPDIWKIDSNIAKRVDVSNADEFVVIADSGETIWQLLERQTGWFVPDGKNPFHQLVLEPGQYYARIARAMHYDSAGRCMNPAADKEIIFLAVADGQLAALTGQLVRICQTVQPEERTFDVFGHDIRNLLILACTEVESHCRGVLVANKVPERPFNTKDYVLLKEAMRLNEYAVSFSTYPWLAPIKPFESWSSASPTKTLPWYSAYNAVKHNREMKFSEATLRHAFEAVAACAVMIAAQFGTDLDTADRRPELRSFFLFSALPVWPLTDVYVDPHGPQGWSEVPFECTRCQT
jgi:hypothetical protein